MKRILGPIFGVYLTLGAIMSRHATFSGIAHNIAHHAGSGLSYISPHLAIALRLAGAVTTEIELLSPEPYPHNAVESQPLRLALSSLHDFSVALMAKHGFGPEEATSIILHATPAPWDSQGYSLHTRAVITSARGRIYDSGWLNEVGKRLTSHSRPTPSARP